MHHTAFIKSIKIQVSYSPHFCLREKQGGPAYSVQARSHSQHSSSYQEKDVSGRTGKRSAQRGTG